jgi:hypothetical protein
VDQDYMRVLLTDAEQDRFTSSFKELVESSGITVYAGGILYLLDWSTDETLFDQDALTLADPAFLNGPATVAMTIQAVFTVDGETNAKRVKLLFETQIPLVLAPLVLSLEASIPANVTIPEGKVTTKGGDKSINGEVFCDKGKQPQSDGAKRQSCT